MNFVQNFNRTTLVVTQRELLFVNLQIFTFFVKHFYFVFTLFTVYTLNDSYVIYRNCSTFQKKQVGQYSEGICVLKFENFNILVTLFSFFCPFHYLQFK